MKSTEDKKERAVLVTVFCDGKSSWKAEAKEEELKRLAESSGVEIVDSIVCRRKMLTADFFIGSGKVEELAIIAAELEADVVIFSDDLSPSQQKNLENIIKTKTIDRTQLILDIFARRAASNEGKVQVELAQLVYLLPRLSGRGIELSRLGGGIGTRGPGEQKLEVDRRRIRERIGKLKKLLKDISRQRQVRRKQREKFSLLTAALCGYTNSGKSTFFNAVTEGHVTAKNQLFSTLDPVVRKISLPNNQTAVISDTVGFLHDLPHHLIESFKATLEEVVHADVLFHVVDISDPCIEEQKTAVFKVLEELGVKDKPIFTILNKADKVPDELTQKRIARNFSNPLILSALKKTGLSQFKDRLVQVINKEMEDIELVIPHKHYALKKLICENGTVKCEEYRENGVFVSAYVPKKVKYAVFKALKGRLSGK
ncbi:MAG: GTPase HflX [Candidatus Omnitrophota bacterium]